jgi:hypothetical protein
VQPLVFPIREQHVVAAIGFAVSEHFTLDPLASAVPPEVDPPADCGLPRKLAVCLWCCDLNANTGCYQFCDLQGS